ncbi:hypothetical protein HPB50_023055 [Hyalomma asiaticum]|uniref:Uncharacterized protein n=1 Tax=Hyalomma asiaticum TaxID=266040 RepID=A0ACB7TP55_HYAAI|nr:hypothetical protein HPB50_023055 [Hyalomma asiaticum]
MRRNSKKLGKHLIWHGTTKHRCEALNAAHRCGTRRKELRRQNGQAGAAAVSEPPPWPLVPFVSALPPGPRTYKCGRLEPRHPEEAQLTAGDRQVRISGFGAAGALSTVLAGSLIRPGSYVLPGAQMRNS